MGYRNVKSHLGLEKWLDAGLPMFNYLGEVKMIKPREINAATDAVDYFQDKR